VSFRWSKCCSERSKERVMPMFEELKNLGVFERGEYYRLSPHYSTSGYIPNYKIAMSRGDSVVVDGSMYFYKIPNTDIYGCPSCRIRERNKIYEVASFIRVKMLSEEMAIESTLFVKRILRDAS